MNLSDERIPVGVDESTASDLNALGNEIKILLEQAYGVQFAILDGSSGEVLGNTSGQPPRDWGMLAMLCREVSGRGRPEFIGDEDPLLTLALPLQDATGAETVAIATFLTRPLAEDENIDLSAKLLGIEPTGALAWAHRQTPWTAESLKRISALVLDGARTRERVQKLQEETNSLSNNLASTYEEISLLYRLTQNLKLSKSDEDLGRIALEWMQEVVPASGLAIQLAPVAEGDQSTTHAARSETVLLTSGDCPINAMQFSALISHLCPGLPKQPIVVNRPITEQADWPHRQIRQLVLVPLLEGENVFGWLTAINHVEDGEFGTVEASLLSSVAAILGIHSGNIELYRQQSQLLKGVVQALTSAIDAKDPYTCGHSDRVARVAVRVAEELGCDTKTIDTLYLAGLLHDIGKIGIKDGVLRKAGKLSDDEYEHIKQHVEIGHRILHDLSKLEGVLPVVLHHHESWDGNGYPSKLGSERIPLAARIMAVADAFDAMSSDRPYRKGMPDARVDEILHAGAGQQWDPDVVAAFFRASDEIRRICREESATQKGTRPE